MASLNPLLNLKKSYFLKTYLSYSCKVGAERRQLAIDRWSNVLVEDRFHFECGRIQFCNRELDYLLNSNIDPFDVFAPLPGQALFSNSRRKFFEIENEEIVIVLLNKFLFGIENGRGCNLLVVRLYLLFFTFLFIVVLIFPNLHSFLHGSGPIRHFLRRVTEMKGSSTRDFSKLNISFVLINLRITLVPPVGSAITPSRTFRSKLQCFCV